MFEQISGSRPAETGRLPAYSRSPQNSFAGERVVGQPSRPLAPVKLRPSKCLGLFYGLVITGLAVLSLLAFVHVLPTQAFWGLPLIAFWLLILPSYKNYRRLMSRHPLQLSADGDTWLLEFPESEASTPALLRGEMLVWPWLVILPFRLTETGETYVLICLPDTACGEDLRRLRVQLRTG